MDIFDTLYLGTPANQALDTPLTPEQKKSMIDAASPEAQRAPGNPAHRPSQRSQHPGHAAPGRQDVCQGAAGRPLLRAAAAHRVRQRRDLGRPDGHRADRGALDLRPSSDADLRLGHHRHHAAADGRIIGLSKYDRVVHHFARRFQVQEELIRQIGDYLVERTAPRGLAVRVQRRAHVQDAPRRARLARLADDQQRLLRPAQERRAAQGRVPAGMPKPRAERSTHDRRCSTRCSSRPCRSRRAPVSCTARPRPTTTTRACPAASGSGGPAIRIASWSTAMPSPSASCSPRTRSTRTTGAWTSAA